jgi:hypothetical protein
MDVVSWLLEDADPALEYQVHRDLFASPRPLLMEKRLEIERGDWAGRLLARRRSDGHWGNGAYNPKWTCTHYVLYELMQAQVMPSAPLAQSVRLLLSFPPGRDGGINYAKTVDYADVCIVGMIVAMASYFTDDEAPLRPLMDFLLKVRMDDGGWNCEYVHGASRSSLHTTIAVLEGIWTYARRGHPYRRAELEAAAAQAVDFILRHELYRSERTGEVIKDEFFKFAFPVRWKYDILRCLDLFRAYKVPYDPRMNGALGAVAAARGGDGRWKAAAQAGKTYFALERNGKPGKWNTLRALRVLAEYS